jgi:carboxymethylenebutenolidase
MKYVVRFVALIVIVASGNAIASSDPFVGTWVLNAQRSKYPPGACPTHMESVPNGIRYRSDTTYAKGRTAHSKYTAEYNGRQALVVGSHGLLLPVSLKRIDSRTVVASYMRGPEVVATSRRVISGDGRRMTITTVARGRRIATVVGVYEKASVERNSAAVSAQTSSLSSTQLPVAPQIVEVPSDAIHLKGYLWKPAGRGPFPAVLFNHGSGAEDPQHTAGRTMAEAASDLAPVFLRHGYVFFYLCRRGQGLSADQGPFTQDLLKQAEASGPETRRQLHYQLITGGQLDDALAGLRFLKTTSDVDPKRIVVAGHSFGGMLTLLSGDHDSTIRAEIGFAAGAKSWHASQELRQRVLASVDNTSAPIMLVYAANDFDTAPGTDIAAELDRLHKPHLLKIYPAVGKTPEDGHGLLYLAMPEWEPDVFQFLDANVKGRTARQRERMK